MRKQTLFMCRGRVVVCYAIIKIKLKGKADDSLKEITVRKWELRSPPPKLSILLAAAAAAAKSLQSCPTLCNPIDGSPPGSPNPWDSPGKNTGEGCYFLLQCMKVKSDGEVAQSCPTLHDPMDCSPSGSSVHGIFQARVLEWGAIAFSDIGI